MKRCARAAAVVGLTVAIGGLSAPVAMADVHLGANVNLQKIRESGPGDLGYNNVEDSLGVATSQLDKSVEAGDFITNLVGRFGQATITPEVEGAEQDQGEKS
ncbi:hypothetical protein ACQEU8_13055 [Streptomyces sp. CA-250714]|uniref:hypothetical protein n=1 Tax=Streptomyces sp. CA-250714 TaxID=3240060 RepID=UPI003D8DB064